MLKNLQKEFYKNIINPKTFKNYRDNYNFKAKDLMYVYHNNYFTAVKNALTSSYSCIKHLVGDDFFSFLVLEFIKEVPVITGNIIDYGGEFAKFIKNNNRCQNLPFLSDVAKFENLYERCYFSLNDILYMSSDYPILAIWQLDENSDNLDLDNGGDFIKISKNNGVVVVEKITKKEFENEKNY